MRAAWKGDKLVRRFGRGLLVSGIAPLVFSCAKVADPLPPLAAAPEPVRNLTWLQVGERIRLVFDAPPPGTRELEIHRHCGPAPATAAGLSLLERIQVPSPAPETELRLRYDAPRHDGTPCTYAVRSIRADGRRAPFSELVHTETGPVAPPPTGLRAKVFENRVTIFWDPPETNVDGSTPPLIEGFLVNSEHFILDPFYEVPDPDPDHEIRIRIQTISRRDDPRVLSRFSEPLHVRPSELLPPSAPTNLTVFILEGEVRLVWDDVPQADVEGYFVYRGESPERMERISPLLRRSRYSDTSAREDRNYYYHVTAVDRFGNESPPSETRISGPFPEAGSGEES